MRFIIFNMFLDLGFRMISSFVNTDGTTASASKVIYHQRFQIIKNRAFIWRRIFSLSEVITSFSYRILNAVVKSSNLISQKAQQRHLASLFHYNFAVTALFFFYLYFVLLFVFCFLFYFFGTHCYYFIWSWYTL